MAKPRTDPSPKPVKVQLNIFKNKNTATCLVEETSDSEVDGKHNHVQLIFLTILCSVTFWIFETLFVL